MSLNVTNSQSNIGVENNGPGSVSVSGGVNVGDTYNNVNNNQGIIIQMPNHNVDDRIEFHVPKMNMSFFGRDQELVDLEKWFTSGEHKMTVVCGCAGYGKTELVKQFVRRLKDCGAVARILWMDAETPDTLLQSFKELALVLRLSQVDDVSLIKSVFSRIESGAGRSVMVFDNAENRQSIWKFEPEGKTMCVVTSRMQDWDDVPILPLTPLSTTGALALLLDKLPRANEQELSVLAAALSRVPLALHVAAGYVRQEMRALGSLFSLSDYVRQIQESCDSLIDTPLPSSSANTYDKTLSQAIQISLDKIQNLTLPNSELIWKILHISAYLYSDKISVDDLLCILNLDIDTKPDIIRACALLQDYSLITLDDFIKIHRFIQNTLVTFQIKNNLEKFYITCLQILFVNNRTSNFHKHIIINHASRNSRIFKNFYIENRKKILKDKLIFVNLISTGCNSGLKIMLTELRDRAANVIHKFCLLHVAVDLRQYEVLMLLLAHGAHINRKYYANYTILHHAAYRIDLCAVKILTSHNADVNATNIDGQSVLRRLIEASGRAEHIARSEEAFAVLRWLVGCGARTDFVTPFGDTLLHLAARVHSVDLVRCLVREFHMDVNVLDEDRATPLYCVSDAVIEDRGRMLRTAACLLELGARRDILDSDGLTPAELARWRQCDYLASYLDNPSPECLPQQGSLDDVWTHSASAGDVTSLTNKLDELGERAMQVIEESCLLHVAVQQRQHDILEMLLARGAHVDARGNYNKTALHCAVDNIDLCAVQILTAHNANVNATDRDGSSVLQRLIVVSKDDELIARLKDSCVVLRCLVERGAHTDIVTSQGKTLLHLAAQACSADFVRCLVCEFGLDVHAADKDSLTPLHCVSMWYVERGRMRRTAACLLELGARRDVLDSQGRTPAQVARAQGDWYFSIWLDYGQSWWWRLCSSRWKLACRRCERRLRQYPQDHTF